MTGQLGLQPQIVDELERIAAAAKGPFAPSSFGRWRAPTSPCSMNCSARARAGSRSAC